MLKSAPFRFVKRVSSIFILCSAFLLIVQFYNKGVFRESRFMNGSIISSGEHHRIIEIGNNKDSTMQKTRQQDAENENDEFMAKMKLRMTRRREFAKKVCKEQGVVQNLTSLTAKFKYLENYKFLFCQIPKTGITNWWNIFNEIGPSDVEPGVILPLRYGVVGEQVTELLKRSDLLKITVVREPFERLLSAYRHKLDVRPYSKKFEVISRNMHRFYGNGLPSVNGFATFDEFVSYLINQPSLDGFEINSHWRSFQDLCQPCAVDYDIIAHQETIDEDSRYIFQLIGAPPELKLQGPYKNHVDGDISRKYFDSVKPKEKLNYLYELVKLDYLVFNYSRPTQLP